MPTNIQIFQTANRSRFRTIDIDGKPWFVFADVCRALDFKTKNGSFSHHAERLDPDDRSIAVIPRDGDKPSPSEGEGGINMIIVNEPGLYTLILRSDKPEAKAFKKWVTSEVLPAIRKTGNFTSGAPQAEWQPFHDRLNTALVAVPEGFFSIFREMADLTAQLITQGAVVDDATIPDISLGQAWAKEWTTKGHENDFGFRIAYEHNYPSSFRQAKSNPQWPWCYPEDALPTFRRWVRNVYLPVNYPQYLTRKVKKGDMLPAVAKATLKAVAATTPKPLR